MLSRRVRAWGVVGAAAAAGACALVTGVGNLQEVPGPEPQADGGCAPSGPEVCTDGVDNDCNGLVDCADPACGAFQCVPAPPTGWALSALDLQGRSPCPSGYPQAADLVVDPNLGPASCSCVCNVTSQATCEVGSVRYYATANPTCNLGDASPGITSVDGKCDLSAFGRINPYHRVDPAPPVGGSCTPMPTMTTPSAGTGRSCGGASTGGGCDAGQVCAPAVGSPFATCVTQAGGVSCPAGYAHAHTAGTGLQDTRACTGCSCAPSCTGATFQWFEDTACAKTVASIPADGQCHPTPSAADASAYQYTATGACAMASAPQPAGTATLVGPSTLCCP